MALNKVVYVNNIKTKKDLIEAIKDFDDDSEVLVSGNKLIYYAIDVVKNGCFPNQQGKDIIELEIIDDDSD